MINSSLHSEIFSETIPQKYNEVLAICVLTSAISTRLFYYPGTFYWCRFKHLKHLFAGINIPHIVSKMEKDKPTPGIGSYTYSWEGILPIALFLKYGSMGTITSKEKFKNAFHKALMS